MTQVLHYLKGDVMLPDLSPSDLRGSERLLGIRQAGFSESSLLTGGSSITNSRAGILNRTEISKPNRTEVCQFGFASVSKTEPIGSSVNYIRFSVRIGSVGQTER